MRKFSLMMIAALCAGWALQGFAQHSVTIKGKVKFIEKDFKVSVYQRSGTDKKILAEVPVNDDHTYSITVPFDKPGTATVDCGQWQGVDVWLEDENMDIDFRGIDTAKIKIKNPPYVYIRAGKKNEVMNLVNFVGYRGYQAMIAISQNVWKTKIEDQKEKSTLTNAMYDANYDNSDAWMKYIVEHYADMTSVLVPLSQLDEDKDVDLINVTLSHLESTSESAKQIVADYRKKKAEEKEMRERMREGNPAPEFTFQNEKGKTINIKKLKGKIIVLDFWASWCGPCRKEIPNVKKVYAEYKDKGIQFLSVSIDAKKEAWTKALKEERMPWMQGWTPDAGKSVMNTYQFGGIPFIILIDKEGNIYRKNLRGEDIKNAIDDCLAGKKVAPKVVMSMGAAMM